MGAAYMVEVPHSSGHHREDSAPVGDSCVQSLNIPNVLLSLVLCSGSAKILPGVLVSLSHSELTTPAAGLSPTEAVYPQLPFPHLNKLPALVIPPSRSDTASGKELL